MFSNLIIPIILCGGSGTRLWPLSRQSFPKQYLSILPDNNFSLLQNTCLRVLKLENINSPILICNEQHRFIVAEQMREIGVVPQAIILEPEGRNTCPAITIAALKAIEENQDFNLLVLSSDHNIKNEKIFLNTIKRGLVHSEKNKLVTFGVVPESPETGYGYIRSEQPYDLDNIKGNRILEFFEKPNLERAKEFIKDKHFTWNSGIFIFKAKKILDEIEKNNPQIIKNCKNSLINSRKDLDFIRIKKDDFLNCKNISIDNAVMEKTLEGIVLPLNVGWNDIGNWKSVWDISEKDSNGNVVKGETILKNTFNSYIRSETRLIATLGIKEQIIVETNDAILIANKENAQDIKKVVEELQNKGLSAGKNHLKMYRPWGNYTSIANGINWQVKLIEVKPNEKLSLQLHHHRSEHWIVVSGTAEVEIDCKSKILKSNESTFIPLGSKHRLGNPSKVKLLLIEVQCGSYLGEDDIVRFEDRYGRNI